MDIYLINTQAAKERLQFQYNQFKKIGLSFKRFNAITTDQITKEIYQRHYHDWQRPLKKTEVACYFSHRAAWDIILKNNQPALILEDDALLSRDLKDLLCKLEKKGNIDLITLEVRTRKKFLSKKKEALTKNKELVRLYQDKTGAAAYILWPSGAKKLLEYEKKYGIALADAQLFNGPKLVTYQIEPAAATQLDCCKFYAINIDGIKQMSISSVSFKTPKTKDIKFMCKRLIAQIKLGMRNIVLLTIAERRQVFLNSNEFE